MNMEQLNGIIANKENQTLEFKKSTAQLRAICETICAFLNRGGGIVLIGVTDSGKILGQIVSDNTRQEISREINKLEPATSQIIIDYVHLEKDKDVIAIIVPQGEYKPYTYDGRAFQRSQSTTLRMSQHLYEQLLVERGSLNYHWDERYAENYGSEALDNEEILRSVRQGIEANRVSEKALAEDTAGILARLKLSQGNELTNAAVVLFANDVRPDYPQCHIKMARFRGTTNTGTFLDSNSFYGNAFKILSEASLFIRRHLPIASFFKEDRFERIDKPALPVLAVREALVNAICHRDYSNRATSIALAIYDNRLEIWNYGALPRGLSLDDLKKVHQSHQRNKLIAEVFYSRGLVEMWGTGTNRMIEVCRGYEVPDPEFSEYSGGFAVTLKFKEPIGSNTKKHFVSGQLTGRQQKIFDLLSNEGELSQKNIMKMLDDTISQRTLRRELRVLRASGVLDTKGYARASVWFVIEHNK